MTPDISRRGLIGGAAAAAVAGSLLPPSLQTALASEPPAGGLDAIRHVVILVQENRSFDNYFGTLRGVRGFGDRNAIELPTGRPVFEQPAIGRTVLPFPVREAAEAQRRDLQYIGDLDHSWNGGAAAWRDGWMDNWVAAKSPATMAYYDRRDLPLHYELADTFTVCDAYHSSVHTSTSPNRNHLVSGWTGFEADGRRAVTNDAYAEGTHPGYPWTTYAERLERAGRSWKTFQEWENFTDNNLEFFASFKAVARKALARAGDFTYMEAFYARVRDADPAERQRLLGLLDEGVAPLTDAERSLFERALRRGETGRLAADFRADVAAGRLPEVSWIVPSAVDSEHPGASSPIASAHLVYDLLDALASHPDVWRRTAFFLTYDENDGFFDHVPPPVPAPDGPGGADEIWEGRPVGLGIRVPMLVISPWSVGGYVCSEVFDHTSVVRFMERWLGIAEPNITDWRRQAVGDLTSAFDFHRARRAPEVEQPGPVPPFTGRWRPEPPAEQEMPAQEPGTRPARPLPYQPDAHGRLDGDTLRLSLANAGSSSVHFALYPYAGEFAVPQHRDVRRTGTWEVPVRGGAYRFPVTGPNGFRREFAGTAADRAEVTSRVDGRTREIRLALVNTGRTGTLTFTVRPLAYTGRPREIEVRPGGSATFTHHTADAHGWYDLEVTATGSGSFRRRLMGHIENGRPSVSG
ncbi:phosphocholine-specific phospholipase C [Streptomyces specialis]|uniref:phosphocholine-specific phospholipase C n=1 Tax=Streptomyces specialis TaxID=498367 RepID=UPI00073F5CD1|nr:phospholipase C, phosphocholine-specific [Streptomyces specialis]